jgi:catechol 2,3-dioxygenase-like lactoylglutathione lyase family enzyme
MITNLNHITLAVKNIDKSFAFYRDILSLKPLVKWDNGAYFLAGDESDGFWFCLNVDERCAPGLGYTHYAFSVPQEKFNQLSEKIINFDSRIFKENTSPGDSLYFSDPDGHKLEIHVGNWKQRIEVKKSNPGNWQNVEWFI